MKLDEMKKILDSTPSEIAGIKFEQALHPLDEYDLEDDELMNDIPASGITWLNLRAISSTYDYPDIYFSMANVDGTYHVLENLYQKHISNYTHHTTFKSLDDAYKHVLTELQEYANPRDMESFVEFNNVLTHEDMEDLTQSSVSYMQ